MRILGVDPGTLRTGVGLIECMGSQVQLVEVKTISANAKLDIPQRLHIIYQALYSFFQNSHAEVMALENVFFGEDLKAMVKIGEARACAMLAAAHFGIPVVEYAPGRVKQSVTGNGRATKDQVTKMIRQIFSISEALTPDSADALAVALCHFNMGAPRSLKSTPKSSGRWTMEDILNLEKKSKASRMLNRAAVFSEKKR